MSGNICELGPKPNLSSTCGLAAMNFVDWCAYLHGGLLAIENTVRDISGNQTLPHHKRIGSGYSTAPLLVDYLHKLETVRVWVGFQKRSAKYVQSQDIAACGLCPVCLQFLQQEQQQQQQEQQQQQQPSTPPHKQHGGRSRSPPQLIYAQPRRRLPMTPRQFQQWEDVRRSLTPQFTEDH